MTRIAFCAISLFVVACQQPAPSDDPMPAPAEAVERLAELTEQLGAEATSEEIAAHLLEAERSATPTRALAMHFSDMDRSTAYGIQLLAMGDEISHGKHLVGWKMGGTRVADPAGSPDPSFAYMLSSDSLENGARLHPDAYVGDSVLVEAEIAFVMGKDLPGPQVSRAELLDAIDSVVGAIEIISVRLLPTEGGPAPSTELMIAGRLSHAGVMIGETRIDVADIDMAAERAVVEVDGEEKSSGAGSQIMNSNPLDALLWLANELPRHGLNLRAGEIVVTGSLYENPTIKAGQTAVVRFESLGDLSVSLAE